MKLYILFTITFLLTLLSNYCIGQQSLSEKQILVIPINKPIPANSKKIGTIKAGNNSTKIHCAYDRTIEEAKQEAMKMGGNVIRITSLVSPTFISGCYKIEADVLYTDKLEAYIANNQLSGNTESKITQTDTAQYASLYIYAPEGSITSSYKLHMNDSVIYKVKDGTKHLVKLYTEGKIKLWSKTESEKSVTFNVKYGNEYYLKCGTEQGNAIAVPTLKIVDKSTGAAEYEKISKDNEGNKKEKPNEVDTDNKSYLYQYH
ncbi:MAG TPA: hypothetical protein VN721_08270 [Flavipsychrobacter sp.]|nr:hypothetical protein [Flavipsychrobacter sp.]